MRSGVATATFGGGCFWCTEAVFQQVKGVEHVESGYSGGNVPGYPTYREICSGRTGHAEVVRITYNPEEVSYATLVRIFMGTHDPTTLNRQGADRGTQYRSVIFYHDPGQETTAREVVAAMQSYYQDPIVTEISPLINYYPAEPEHQDYYRRNTAQGYCQVVISPKLRKLRETFSEYLESPAGQS
ncbi:peptide-methionine (S)-S-oxide reductase MsrA [Robiginitalea sediminis]|uniref:peptide-methionine (S)-S-oxide reductase MsrA n=1 Tax=Robiginitalea sediminis TaxID=1982593 RepID=UPI000B4B1D10|nr:peptide-methionine (S)-S-oxide reductase MsrA [Robiginitalea sediminis]